MTGRPALSLKEKDYVTADRQKLWEDLVRFYEHFGLSYDLRQCKEWPDWIGIELEFLHYLTFMEAGTTGPAQSAYVAAEADFLERHLATWASELGAGIETMASATPYARYASVLREFVAADAEFTRTRRERPCDANSSGETYAGLRSDTGPSDGA